MGLLDLWNGMKLDGDEFAMDGWDLSRRLHRYVSYSRRTNVDSSADMLALAHVLTASNGFLSAAERDGTGWK